MGTLLLICVITCAIAGPIIEARRCWQIGRDFDWIDVCAYATGGAFAGILVYCIVGSTYALGHFLLLTMIRAP